MKKRTQYRIALSILVLVLLGVANIQNILNKGMAMSALVVISLIVSLFIDNKTD